MDETTDRCRLCDQPRSIDDERYTLDEAERELRKRECDRRGHAWQIDETLGGGPIMFVCSRCGWSGTVTMGARP